MRNRSILEKYAKYVPTCQMRLPNEKIDLVIQDS